MGIDTRAICTDWFADMCDGGPADFALRIHPQGHNREAITEPLACRQRGPAGAYATALLLRDAFAELDWQLHDVLADGELMVAHVTMSGRHVRTLYSYDEHARVSAAFPPTGRRFAVTQTHWCRLAEGKILEHWANRDDPGMAGQLGWVPPGPIYLARVTWALRQARRAEARYGGAIPAGHHCRHPKARQPDDEKGEKT